MWGRNQSLLCYDGEDTNLQLPPLPCLSSTVFGLTLARCSTPLRAAAAVHRDSWEKLANRDGGCVCCLWASTKVRDLTADSSSVDTTTNILDRWHAASLLTTDSWVPGSLLSLQDKLFKHSKIHKGEINCRFIILRQMETKLCAILWWMGYKWHLLTAKCHMGGGGGAHGLKACVFPVSLWLQGCLWRHNLCVCVGIEADLVSRFIWDSFILQFGERKHARGTRTPWKAGSISFPPLPAESFTELTVKLQMFSERPAVIFLPLDHKTEEERLNSCRGRRFEHEFWN